MKTILLSLAWLLIFYGTSFAQFNKENPIIVNGSVTDPMYSIPKVVAVDSGYFITYYDEADGFKMYMQFIDPKGNILWGDPIVVTDYEQDSWVSDYTLISDGHNVYVFFSDARNGTSDKDIFGYKFNQQGQFLWDSAGIELVVATSDYDSELAPKATVLSNGNVVSAWSKMDAAGYTISMQWLTSDGDRIWTNGNIVSEVGLRYYEPNLLPATDSTVFLVYIYQNGMYGDRQIHVQQIDTTGQNVWDNPIVITENSGIGMGRTFSISPANIQGIYVTWYGDPDFNGANDVFTQKLNVDGTLSFNSGGLNLSPNDAMNQTMPFCAGEDYYGNAVYMWQEVNGSNTGDLIKTQLVSPSGDLLLGDAAVTVTDQYNMHGKAKYIYGQLYCPAKSPGNNELKMVIYNYQNNDTSLVNMGMYFEEMSDFENGQFVVVDISNDQVRAQNISFRGESGSDILASESTLSAFAEMSNFHPDTLFYYLPADSAHIWNEFATPMNIYQNIDLLNTVSLDAGNYRVNVYAEDGTYTTYQFSFVNEPGSNILSAQSSQVVYLDIDLKPQLNQIYIGLAMPKIEVNWLDLELTPGARLYFNDNWDIDYSQINDSLMQTLWMLPEGDTASLLFNIVDYNGISVEWEMLLEFQGGGISISGFNGKVYPVPANNQLYIESLNRINEIQLVDLQGRELVRQIVNNKKAVLPVSNIQLGVYLLKVMEDKGVGFRKVIIE